MPRIDILPGAGMLRKVAGFLLEQCHYAQRTFDSSNTGAAPMLDKQLEIPYDTDV
ncbi:MAG: hypothetical protein V4440_04505 [Pseudomonadota bacterium]